MPSIAKWQTSLDDSWTNVWSAMPGSRAGRDPAALSVHDARDMSPDPRLTPTHVKAPRGGRVLEITWGDGHHALYPHEVLRGYCPCAGCQGHSGTIQFIPGGEIEARLVPGGDLDLREIEQVGNYALRFVWGDRHETGIYTFRYLRALCQCNECRSSAEKAERPDLPRM